MGAEVTDDGQWWVLREGITLGPYTLEELRRYATRGKLYADDLVSAAGETDWAPAGLAPALGDLFPADGSEDATVALEPALRALAAMAATPVPARRSSPAASPLRGSTLPPRLPTDAAPAVTPAAPVAAPAAPVVAPAAPVVASAAAPVAPTAAPVPSVAAPIPLTRPAVPAPAVPAPAAPAPSPRGGLASSLVVGLVASVSTLGLERAIGGPQPAQATAAAATPAIAAPAPARELPSVSPDASAPHARVVADAGAPPGPTLARCVGAAALAHVARTRAMLRTFDELMHDAAPPADPFDYGALATACLTTVARSNDRPRATLDSARAAEALRVRHTAEARQALLAQQWRAMAFTWDAGWRTRVVTRRATYGCFAGDWGEEREDECTGEWRQRTPAVNGPAYTLGGAPAQPELQRRVDAAGSVHPEAEQFCEVLDAVLGPQRLTVTCSGDDAATAYDLWLPRELAAPATAPLAGVMVGDVLRVTGHAVVKREPVTAAGAPRGAERWTFEEVPASGVTVSDHTRCCALTERTVPASP